MNSNKLTNFNLIILILSISLLANAHPPRLELRSKDPEKPLALLSLQTKVFVQSAYAEIQYIQRYQNPYPHPLKAEFHSPRTENTIFHKFEAFFEDQIIVGKIFEKRKAKDIYEWNVSRDRNLASSNKDVTKVYIGSIPAYETVEIRFSVLKPLEIIINQFWSLTLDAPSSEYFQYSFCQEWEIEVEIKSPQPFNFINNPSHYVKPDLFAESNSKFYKVVWRATLPLNKDFVMHWRFDNIEYPNTILATHPNYPDDHVLFINFIPQLTKLMDPELLEEGEVLELKGRFIKEDIQNVRTEFIFLIDLSSSIGSEKINKLRKILENFLLILPRNSRFNLLSFGRSSSFHPAESLPLSSENLQKAFAWIATINGDMESTESLPAFKQLMDTPQIQGYPRTIILLTDRNVLSSLEAIGHIRQHSDEVRVYPMGIEDGPFEVFVKNTEFELDNEEIREKAIDIISNITSQSLENIELKTECFNSQKKLVFTGSKKERFLFKDKLFKKWIYLRNIPDLEYCNTTISYFNSLKQENIVQELKIDGLKTEERTSAWHKIAYYPKINKKIYLINQVVELSTRYQILSSLVSFLPVIIKTQEYSQDISAEEFEKKFISIIFVDKASLFDRFLEIKVQEEAWKQNKRDYSTHHFGTNNKKIPVQDFNRIIECLGCFGALVVMSLGEKIKRKKKIFKRFRRFMLHKKILINLNEQ